ncbi:hypothetical protein ACMUMQ_15785 [Marinomonas sp. 2405UD66-6]|uniref:hypothetical protein n=1 Tax=Marinomonas sp. 2405UD66-6 TaxID=3391834 RepID=UPI0039C8ED27
MSEVALEFSPWMVESAYKYAVASRVLLNERNLEGVSQINAALSIEIALKALLSTATKNSGKVYQNSKFDKNKAEFVTSFRDAHDIYKLACSIPEGLKEKILSPRALNILQRYGDTFVADRYRYEECSRRRPIITDLTFIALELVDNIVEIYKSRGCDDCWIIAYPNV